MPLDFPAIVRDTTFRIRSPQPAQQQIGSAAATVARLGQRHCEYMLPQLRLLQPPRNRALENSRPLRAEPSSGDNQHTATSGGARAPDKGGEFLMSLGLCQSMQIEPCLDFVQTTL